MLGHAEAHYDVQEVEMGEVYARRPESIVVESDCGERLTLTAPTTTCGGCGADHKADAEEGLTAGQSGDEAMHPWRCAEDREAQDCLLKQVWLNRKGSSEATLAAEHTIEARPRNWLVPVILLTLRECTSYGYKLMEQAAAFGFVAMNPGTLYRTLRHMERDGLCESEWDTTNGGGPARRVYTITDAGEAYLDFWAESLSSTSATWTPSSGSIRAGHQHAETGRKTTGSGRGFGRPRERMVDRSEQPALPHWTTVSLVDERLVDSPPFRASRRDARAGVVAPLYLVFRMQ
jgi:poly-beta-hydroxybutyrate-responsive repressor